MSALSLLKSYHSGSESDNESDNDKPAESEPNTKTEETFDKPINPEFSLVSKITIESAPLVHYSKEQDEHEYVDPSKELMHNPRYEEMWTPTLGPDNPLVSDFHKAPKNTLTGYVEPANVNDFQFENQRRTFNSFGYAYDPSFSANQIIGDIAQATENNVVSVFEKSKLRPKDKRKRERNDDPSDINGFKGPWASFKDQLFVAKPSEEEKIELDQIYAKKNKHTRFTEQEEKENKSTLHIDDPCDYQGRSFLHIPQDLDVNLRSEEPPEKCFIPKKCLHTYTGHTKGIQRIQLFPQSGHLFLTCSMDSKVKLWEFYKGRRCIRTYSGHSQGVRDVSFNRNGSEFLTASYDRYIKLWDTESGACKAKFTNKKIPYCVVFNPDEDKQNLFICGTSDKKILCYDTRSGEIVQEYDRHLGAVNTVTFVDRNRRIVSTSDDKSIRAWEWDIPVDFKYIADPTMHSMPAVTLSRNGKYLAFQSMDNQIKIMEPLANFRWKNKKTFRGHMVAGYACGLDFSPDMSYMISGDANGNLVVWDWKTTRIFERIKAHEQVCMDVKWHPHESSKILTCGWDGVVHL